MTTTAAAASLTPAALPAVTVPSFLKAGLSLASASAERSSRMCSSRVNSIVSRLLLIGTGMSSSRNLPASVAACARRWDVQANSSWSSREMAWESARFSAVMPMWIASNGSVRLPTVASITATSPIRAPQRAAGIQ